MQMMILKLVAAFETSVTTILEMDVCWGRDSEGMPKPPPL